MTQPSLEDAFAKAKAVRAAGQLKFRLEVEPSRRYGQRFVRLWDYVVAKIVGRRTERRFDERGTEIWEVRALILELNAIDVEQAMQRKVLREAQLTSEPARPNRMTAPGMRRVSTAR